MAAVKEQTYTIQLPQFKGPFDLLLFFIERDELDIYNIPIAKITNDFLGYIRQMEALNVDLASEFILMAATLCRIKARVLLPRKVTDEEGNEIDPREELVQRLLEYKTYKQVLDEFKVLEEDRNMRSNRGNVVAELKEVANKALTDIELESVSLFKLFKAYIGAIERQELRDKKTIHTVFKFPYSIKDQQEYILRKIDRKHKVNFSELFENLENRIHAIVTFLALLELLNLQKVGILQGIGFNNFWISRDRIFD